MRAAEGMRNWLRSCAGAGAAAVLALGAAGCGGSGGDEAAPSASAERKGSSPSSGPPASAPVSAGADGWNTRPGSIAAVGDSITRAFDACGLLKDCPDVSWATGTDPEVRSLAVRLLGAGRAATHSWNHAVSGARMADLEQQMAKAAARRPDLVTVMVGANDACRPTTRAMTPVSAFRAQFEKALRTLRSTAPEAQVFVASVPDLKRLWATGREKGAAVWGFGVCPSMLADPMAQDAEATARRAAVDERVDAYNEVLEEVCARDARCRFDGGAVHAFRFGAEHLSRYDWFHPSAAGQARLAEIVHRKVTSPDA